MTRAGALGLIGILPIYLAVASALGFIDHQIRRFPDRAFLEYSPSVIAGTAEPPGRYRVLAPHVYAVVGRVTGLGPLDAWVLFRWLSLVAALVAWHFYLRTWFDDGVSLAGTLLASLLLLLTFTNSWGHPDHLVEFGLFTIACAAVARGHTGAFAVLLVLNALNRETSAFLLPLFALSRPLTRRHVVLTLTLGLLWAAVFVGLRMRLGWVSYDPWQVKQNLTYLALMPAAEGRTFYTRAFAWFVAVMLAPAYWLIARTWAVQPRFMRVAATIVVPAYLVVAFLFSTIVEARIFTLAIPLVVPSMLVALFGAPRAAGPMAAH